MNHKTIVKPDLYLEEILRKIDQKISEGVGIVCPVLEEAQKKLIELTNVRESFEKNEHLIDDLERLKKQDLPVPESGDLQSIKGAYKANTHKLREVVDNLVGLIEVEKELERYQNRLGVFMKAAETINSYQDSNRKLRKEFSLIRFNKVILSILLLISAGIITFVTDILIRDYVFDVILKLSMPPKFQHLQPYILFILVFLFSYLLVWPLYQRRSEKSFLKLIERAEVALKNYDHDLKEIRKIDIEDVEHSR